MNNHTKCPENHLEDLNNHKHPYSDQNLAMNYKPVRTH